jgi:hypothetical protein
MAHQGRMGGLVPKAAVLLLLMCAVSSADTIMCNGKYNLFAGTILPLVAGATAVTIVLIAGSFMFGTATSNPKLTLWAKTEIVQLIISLAAISIIMLAVTTFCNLDMKEVADIFGLSGTHPSMNVYDAAKDYLNGAAQYSHNALRMVRYHLEGYTVLSYLNAFMCDFKLGRIGLGCLFGYSGNTEQPFGGYGADIAALNIFFNGMIMAHFTALNFLFILLFIYKGFVFLFLPLGIFLRSLPYMRPVGSALIAIALSFLTIYPFTLAVFNLMGDTLLDRATGYAPAGVNMDKYDESVFPDSANAGSQMGISIGGESVAKCAYFGNDKGVCIAAAVAADFAAAGTLASSTRSRTRPARLCSRRMRS